MTKAQHGGLLLVDCILVSWVASQRLLFPFLMVVRQTSEDGKTMIDEHLSASSDESSDLTVPFALVLFLALFVAVFLIF